MQSLGLGLSRGRGMLKSFFKRLQSLTHPMVVATKGNNPLETGRYPQPTTVLELDGVNQKVQVDHTDDFNLQSFTFTTWVKASTWDNGGQTTLFVKPFSSHLSPFYEYGLFVAPAAVSFWRQGANFSLPVTLPLGTWVHVALVYGNSSIALYINGVIEHSQSISTFNVTHWGEDIYLFGQGNLSVNSLIGNSSDTCLYSETFTADEVAMDMAGDNPHNPLFCLPLNQTSGTVALDRNDNANSGTLINGASWVVDNTLPWQADVTNEEGYTLGTGSNGAAVGVIIPPSTIDPTKDCLGNDLQWAGSVYPVIPVPEGSSALRFDTALANYLPTGIVPNENTKLTVIARWHNISTVVGDFMGAGKDAESKAFLFGVNATDTSEWYASYYSANGVTGIPTDTEWHQFVLESNGDSATFSVDEVSVNLPAGVKAAFNDEICIAARDTSTGITSFADAEVSYVKIEQDGLVVFESGCTETSGAVVHDTSGNGNHGTLVNGPTWVNTRDGYGTNLNQLRGFTLDGSVRIPALADGSGLDARDGLPLTNPVDPNLGIAKGAENTSNVYEITELGDHTAATVELSGGAAIADSDTKADVMTATGDRVFKNNTTGEIVAFYDTLTGDDFDKADSYTS